MTNRELIAKLQALPLDLPVTTYSYDDYQDEPESWVSYETVEVSDDGKSIRVSY